MVYVGCSPPYISPLSHVQAEYIGNVIGWSLRRMNGAQINPLPFFTECIFSSCTVGLSKEGHILLDSVITLLATLRGWTSNMSSKTGDTDTNRSAPRLARFKNNFTSSDSSSERTRGRNSKLPHYSILGRRPGHDPIVPILCNWRRNHDTVKTKLPRII